MGVERSSRQNAGVAQVLIVIAVTLLWRLPSFFDPPWVNDEGTYFAIAQAMARGYRLYAGVWENKPPALYLLYEAVYQTVGVSLPAVRVLAAASVVAMVALVMWVAGRFGGVPAVAGVLGGLVMGVPFLEGTTANAEVFLVVLTSLGVLLALRHLYLLSGLALGVAVLFKAVAGFDAVALGLFLLVHGGLMPHGEPISMRVRAAPVLLYALGLFVPLLAASALALEAGIWTPMFRDALLYPLGYVGHGNGGGVPVLLVLKLGALIALTIWLLRRPFPHLWLAWSACGALASGRFFGHYALQAVPALCLVIASLPIVRHRVLSRRALLWLPAGFLALALLSAGAGWALASTGHDTILARRLQWYANFARLAIGAEPYTAYRDQVDDHVTRNIRIAREIGRLPHGKLLVWGNTPWVYVLSHRLPATPYTSSLRQPEVPGETRTLRSAVKRHLPAVLVIIEPAAPPLGQAAAGLRAYRAVTTLLDARVYAARALLARRRAR